MNDPRLSARVLAPKHVLMQELDGEAAFLNIDSQYYYGLDEVGTRMWQLLTSSASIGRARDLLLEEFDVEPERLESDLLGLVEELARRGLVELRPADEAAAG